MSDTTCWLILSVAVIISARDSLELPSYLSLPPVAGAPASLPTLLREDEDLKLGLPLVLYVHGGGCACVWVGHHVLSAQVTNLQVLHSKPCAFLSCITQAIGTCLCTYSDI